MPKVLHIVDADTSQDSLDQLALLAGGSDRIVSVGRPPEYDQFPLLIQAVHCPLGLGQLGGWSIRGLAGQADIIHTWSRKSALAGRSLRVLTGKPVVLSWPSLPERKDMALLTRLAGRWGIVLIVPTEIAQTALGWAGAEKKSVHVLPPAAAAIEPERQVKRRREIREALGLSDNQFLLVAPAEMRAGAGHKYACWAHAIVRQIIDGVCLFMPSDGPNRQRVSFFAATTGYDEEILYREHLDQEREQALRKLDALAAADAAVFFGERDTGLSALVEAMAAGVAIAASNTPDVAECAPAGEVALLSPCCDPRSASADVLRLVEDKELRKSLATTAKDRATKFHSTDQCRQALASIYSSAATQQ